jgi:hypothetical protein
MNLRTFTKKAIALYEEVKYLTGPIKIGWDKEYYIEPNSAQSYHVLGKPYKQITYSDVAKFLLNFPETDDLIVARLGTYKDREKRIKNARKETKKWRTQNENHPDESVDIWQANGYADEKNFYDEHAYDYSTNDNNFIIIVRHL